MRLTLLALALAALVGCGGGDDDSASAFGERQLDLARKGQNGRRWDELHPAHQAIVTKDAFITCTQDDSAPISDIDAIDEYDETLGIPELGEIETRAVTVEYHIGDVTDAITMHVLQVDGDWKWFLSPDHIAAFQAGECP